MRVFFGATFLYAGVDKLLDPGFLDPASPASIQAQMTGFTRASPLGELIRLAQPEAAAVGLLIAVAEIGIGLGALSGVAYRIAAVGGALLSILFFLTVSWTTRPFYLGSDLPFAAGWLTLAIAGQGRPRAAGAAPDPAESPQRRALLQAGLLGLAAVAVASVAVPLRLLGLGHQAGASTPTPTPAASGAGAPASGRVVARTADVDRRGSAAFTVPFDAPAPLPAGDPGVIVRLADGAYVAFDAVCPHAGCTVGWNPSDSTLLCPCHGAAFDPARAGSVLAGPAEQPLAGLPIVVDPATGSILLRI